jgi:general secretion pathway protein J
VGFTLIEMTVAMALLGLISVLVFESLRFGQRSYQSATRKGAESWEVFAAQRLLRNLVESAYPQQPGDVGTTAEPGLQGDPQRMFVTAPAPLAMGGAGLYRYEIALRSNATGRNDLVIRWRAQMPDAAGLNDRSAEEILLPGVAGLRMSYQSATGWSERWAEPGLPQLVRLQVTFAAGDLRTWPDMIATPRITDDANCVFDVVAQRCRRST